MCALFKIFVKSTLLLCVLQCIVIVESIWLDKSLCGARWVISERGCIFLNATWTKNHKTPV